GSATGLFRLLRETAAASLDAVAAERRAADTRPIRTAKQYIQEYFAQPLTLEEVSGIAGFNPSYFSSLFKKECGQNFTEYLAEVRIAKAKELLRESKLSVAEICEAVGYLDLKYFTKTFKKSTGIKPGEFRKLYS
ncbi:MAG: helix-turn-helix domain-containing protein, partial [Pygmaiobacter massiliensis]|nr:helix-turn-helix domain-containing protein [Pygmaiobacter massiliensis]